MLSNYQLNSLALIVLIHPLPAMDILPEKGDSKSVRSFFKALKTKAQAASISKINHKTKIKANIAKELQ